MPTPRMTQEEALIRVELRSLVDEYAAAVDAREFDAWVELFAPDGEFSGRNAGDEKPFGIWKGEQLKTVFDGGFLDQFEHTFHFVGNHRVSFDDPERPRGITYCLAHQKFHEGGPTRAFINVVRYLDEYVLTGEGWRFARREAVVLWNEDHEIASTPIMASEEA